MIMTMKSQFALKANHFSGIPCKKAMSWNPTASHCSTSHLSKHPVQRKRKLRGGKQCLPVCFGQQFIGFISHHKMPTNLKDNFSYGEYTSVPFQKAKPLNFVGIPMMSGTDPKELHSTRENCPQFESL